MPQQSEILKSLLSEYLTGGGDVNDLESATAYINLHKPPGVGQAKPVITQAIFRLMGHRSAKPKPLPPAPPPESPRIVIASKQVTFPAEMRDKPQAVFYITPVKPAPKPEQIYYEAPPAPPAPPSTPAKGETTSDAPKPKKPLLERLKFWKKWKS